MPIQLIDNPTERTTAATDVLLTVLALGSIFYLHLVGSSDPWKTTLWGWAFGLLALGAALGAVAHGLEMSAKTNRQVWQPLNLALGLVVAFFVVGVTYDLWGLTIARRVLPVMIGLSLLFFATTQFFQGTFFVFIIYQGLAMVFALSAYGWLALTSQLAGAWLMVAGVALTLTAAVAQSSRAVSFTFIWTFDHNGVYHLIQMVAILFLVAGLQVAFVSNGSSP